ncbi:MAG: hypothetical protein JJU00_11765 [Opitutales bacterium]|nr:hypothetical protein [Opitutales bacterium]
MPDEPVWNLLGIIIALTAYVATVRRRILDKAADETRAKEKRSPIKYAALLMFADVPLVFSGVLLAVFNFVHLSGNEPCPWVDPTTSSI